MIESYIIFLSLMGVIAAILTWLVVTEGKRPRYLPALTLTGITTGLLSATIWAYLTNGLNLTVNSVAITMLLSSTLSIIILYYLPLPRTSYSGKGITASMFIMLLLAFLFAYSSTPYAYPTTLSSTQLLNVNLDDVKQTSEVTNPQIPITIDDAVSSVSLFSTSETPKAGDYLNFRITFSSSVANWEEPYITLAVYEDTNGNNQYDVNDKPLNNQYYKVATGNSEWCANIIYDAQPHEICTVDNVPLPIFHASSLSNWKDDTQYTFPNTPEQFKPKHDMISWDANGNLKENVLAYSSIPVGVTSAIEGKIFCQNTGSYYIVVKTFDARFTTPYEAGQPLSEKIIPFTVLTAEDNAETDWFIPIIGLIALTIPAVGITITRRW